MLKVENLQYGYPGGPEVLKDISFTLDEGQFMAILGNNGAGKSTMLKSDFNTEKGKYFSE